VHCDVSAGNFCLDVNGTTRVYLIDFGLARLIKRQIAGSKHKEAEFFGTPRYAPLAAHTLRKQGFRDDLESLAYVFYTPITGKSLPWSGLDSNKDKAKIVSMKRQVPPEIRSFVLKCRKLRLDEMPVDYQEFVAALIE
jgi:casein kinase 1